MTSSSVPVLSFFNSVNLITASSLNLTVGKASKDLQMDGVTLGKVCAKELVERSQVSRLKVTLPPEGKREN